MVYIIGNKDLNVCKIGFSERPKKRIKSIQDAVPFELEIFSIIKGDREKEKLLHNKYEEYRIKGEWFTLDIVTESGVSFEYITFLEDKVVKNEDYYLLPSLLRVINKHRHLNDLNPFNITQFLNRNDIKILLNDMKNRFGEGIIQKGFSRWVHEIIFTEIARSVSAKAKLEAFELLFKKP